MYCPLDYSMNTSVNLPVAPPFLLRLNIIIIIVIIIDLVLIAARARFQATLPAFCQVFRGSE